LIPYQAGARGVVRVTVRRPGRPLLVDRTATTNGGLGRLRTGRALPRGKYDVHLVLMTPAGGATQTRERIDTRKRLRVAEARRAVSRVISGGDGDGGDGWETSLGRCERRAGRHLACQVIYSWYSLDESWRKTCRGWAHARLRLDGVRVLDDEVRC
jgi:hypothetical protein